MLHVFRSSPGRFLAREHRGGIARSPIDQIERRVIRSCLPTSYHRWSRWAFRLLMAVPAPLCLARLGIDGLQESGQVIEIALQAYNYNQYQYVAPVAVDPAYYAAATAAYIRAKAAATVQAQTDREIAARLDRIEAKIPAATPPPPAPSPAATAAVEPAPPPPPPTPAPPPALAAPPRSLAVVLERTSVPSATPVKARARASSSSRTTGVSLSWTSRQSRRSLPVRMPRSPSRCPQEGDRV